MIIRCLYYSPTPLMSLRLSLISVSTADCLIQQRYLT